MQQHLLLRCQVPTRRVAGSYIWLQPLKTNSHRRPSWCSRARSLAPQWYWYCSWLRILEDSSLHDVNILLEIYIVIITVKAHLSESNPSPAPLRCSCPRNWSSIIVRTYWKLWSKLYRSIQRDRVCILSFIPCASFGFEDSSIGTYKGARKPMGYSASDTLGACWAHRWILVEGRTSVFPFLCILPPGSRMEIPHSNADFWTPFGFASCEAYAQLPALAKRYVVLIKF